MECTIVSSPSWSCLVSTRAEGSNDVPYSPQLTSKDEVDVWIRRALAALLCPHLSCDTFKTMDADQIKDATDPLKDGDVLTVTKDIVVIYIEDPSGADLSFVDLPGRL